LSYDAALLASVLAFFIGGLFVLGFVWSSPGIGLGGIALGYTRWTRFMIVMTFDTP
jgi:hypothetical protein